MEALPARARDASTSIEHVYISFFNLMASVRYEYVQSAADCVSVCDLNDVNRIYPQI
jgi:hypothetical protein